MNLSEARKQGYAFAVTDGRLVFRTPYGQLDSFGAEVNRQPVRLSCEVKFNAGIYLFEALSRWMVFR